MDMIGSFGRDQQRDLSGTLGDAQNDKVNAAADALPGPGAMAYAKVGILGATVGIAVGAVVGHLLGRGMSRHEMEGLMISSSLSGAFAGGAAGVASGLLAASAERRAIATATVGK